MTTRILVAESDSELRGMWARFLRNQSWQVETVSNGLDCLKEFRRILPEVLILDWEMPWGGGAGVLSVLREEFPLLPLTIVIVAEDTTSLRGPTIARPFALACCERPFPMSQVVRLIRTGIKRGECALCVSHV
jgi:DNA-binding response OmpR family regulator